MLGSMWVLFVLDLWFSDLNRSFRLLYQASFTYKAKPKLQVQFDTCDDERIPLSVIVGKSEIEAGEVKIKDMTSKDKAGGGGIAIPRAKMIEEIRSRLAQQA